MLLKILELQQELADRSVNSWKGEIESLTEKEEIENAHMELGYFMGTRSNIQSTRNMINAFFGGESND